MLAYVHFRMPTGRCAGKPFVASFSCSKLDWSYKALLTFGCVLNVNVLADVTASCTEHSAASSVMAVSVKLPLISNDSTMPSLVILQHMRSAITNMMGCWIVGCAATTASAAAAALDTIRTAGANLSSFTRASSNDLVLPPFAVKDMPLTAGARLLLLAEEVVMDVLARDNVSVESGALKLPVG